MKKYLLIGKKFDNLKRHFLIGERLAARYPEYLEIMQEKHVKDLLELNDMYRRLIFWTQAPIMYSFPLTFITLRKLNHVVFIRNEHNMKINNSCSNGFYYYKQYPSLKHFAPIITTFPQLDNILEQEIPCLGFYIRPFLVPDSYLNFVNLVKSIKTKIKVFILGDDAFNFSQFSHVKEYKQTYDNKEFFRNITHFVYPQSRVFQDPFPHCLLEAIQTGKQIILPTVTGRNFKDGIDDIKDCVRWHKDFNPKVNYDNSDCILTGERFEKFHKELFDNDFEYSFDRSKYKTFEDWVIGET